MRPPGPAIQSSASQGAVRRGLRVALLWAMILAPALLLARPAVFADTPLYYGQGEALARVLVHGLARAVGHPQGAPDAVTLGDPFAVVRGSLGARTGALLVAGARSPTYGLMLYLCHLIGGLRALVALQAGLAAVAVEIFLARFTQKNSGAFLAGALLLALGSSLPFFAAFAMPDVFAGLDLLLIAVILVGRPSLGERICAAALLIVGAAVHPTHLLILLLMAVAGPILLRVVFKAPFKTLVKPALGLAAAAMAAMGLESAEHGLIAGALGEKERAPPFLMARLLEDGPGRAYLAKACPQGAAPLLCRFANRKLNDSEAFLWSGRKADGVVMTLPPDARARLKAQEPGFVLAVLETQPLNVARAALVNMERQLLLFPTIEPLHSPSEFAAYPFWRKTALYLRDKDGCAAAGACRPRVSAPLLNLEETLATLLGLAGACAAFVRRPAAGEGSIALKDAARLRSAFALLALGVVLNAAACGALSGAFPRYEARLLWVLPLCGLTLFLNLRAQHSPKSFEARSLRPRVRLKPLDAPNA